MKNIFLFVVFSLLAFTCKIDASDFPANPQGVQVIDRAYDMNTFLFVIVYVKEGKGYMEFYRLDMDEDYSFEKIYSFDLHEPFDDPTGIISYRQSSETETCYLWIEVLGTETDDFVCYDSTEKSFTVYP